MTILVLLATTLALAQGVAARAAPIDHVTSRIQVERLQGGLGAAPSNIAPRPLNQLSMMLIRDFEGWSPKPYNDAAGYCTIGFGHLIALKSCDKADIGPYGGGISEQRGLEILEADTAYARLVVRKYVSVPLSADEFGALSSFVFNVGEGNFKNSHLRMLVQSGQSRLAIREFGRWVSAGNKVQQGLVARRKCEASLFAGQLSLADSGKFERSKCVSLGIGTNIGTVVDIDRGEEN
jgi:lysozyme